MINNEEGSVITVGYDDFTKAAGHGMTHGNADHITFRDANKTKKVLTTGFIENIGYSGEDGAEDYT